jgi:hypothetical protein
LTCSPVSTNSIPRLDRAAMLTAGVKTLPSKRGRTIMSE